MTDNFEHFDAAVDNYWYPISHETHEIYFKGDGRFNRFFKYFLIFISAYFVIPGILFQVGGQNGGMGILILGLLIVLPLFSLLTGLIYGLYHKFSGLLALLAGYLWIPFAFFYFNYTALFYAFSYVFFVVVGEIVGVVIRKYSGKMSQADYDNIIAETVINVPVVKENCEDCVHEDCEDCCDDDYEHVAFEDDGVYDPEEQFD